MPSIKFVTSWVNTIIATIGNNASFNLLFPAHYTNIDRNPMGWPGISGVAKYYGFYVGPLLAFILVSFIYLFSKIKSFRSYFFNLLKNDVVFTALFLGFLAFFTIAEIFPRFPKIALLPERAWIFASIFSFIFIFAILEYFKKIPKIIIYIFFTLLAIGLMGTYYINHLKGFVITSEQMKSAEWIKGNLPENRVIVSPGNKNTIGYHANSILFRVPSQSFCSPMDFQNLFSQVDSQNNPSMLTDEKFNTLLTNYQEELSAFRNVYSHKNNNSDKELIAKKLAEKNIELSTGFLKSLNNGVKEKDGVIVIAPYTKFEQIDKPFNIEVIRRFNNDKIKESLSKNSNKFYIYHAETHPKDPYSSRPYKNKSEEQIHPCTLKNFIFNQYPDKFKEVYNDNNQIIIWEML